MAMSKKLKILQWRERYKNLVRKCKCFDSNIKKQNDYIKIECFSKKVQISLKILKLREVTYNSIYLA